MRWFTARSGVKCNLLSTLQIIARMPLSQQHHVEWYRFVLHCIVSWYPIQSHPLHYSIHLRLSLFSYPLFSFVSSPSSLSYPMLHLLSHLSPYPTPPVSSLPCPHARLTFYLSLLYHILSSPSYPMLHLLSHLSPAPMHPAVNTSQLSLGLSHTMFVTASRTVVSKKRSVLMRSIYFEGKEGKKGNEGNEFVR
jgi:hypothetical protein